MNNELNIAVKATGLPEKIDAMNKAIYHLREAERWTEIANRIFVNVEVEAHPPAFEFEP